MTLVDLESERIVLAAVLTGNTNAVDNAVAVVTSNDFVVPEHQQLFDATVALHMRGEQIDPRLVADEAGLDRAKVVQLFSKWHVVTETVGSYAAKVAELGVRRRLHARLLETEDVVADVLKPMPVVSDQLDKLHAVFDAQPMRVEPALEASELASQMVVRSWVVPDLLARQDRLVITGAEGGGKSTFLRQMAVQIASGIHPVTGRRFTPCAVLQVDLENSQDDVAEKIRELLGVAGSRYPKCWHVKCRPQGIDLLKPADVAWLDGLLRHHKPDVLIAGPIYKMAAGAPKDEEVAHKVASVLDRLRIKYRCALILEHHSPHGEGNDRAGWRPFGASLWLRWPEFGFGLALRDGMRECEFKPWRGPRDRNRQWPRLMRFSTTSWPWEVIE